MDCPDVQRLDSGSTHGGTVKASERSTLRVRLREGVPGAIRQFGSVASASPRPAGALRVRDGPPVRPRPQGSRRSRPRKARVQPKEWELGRVSPAISGEVAVSPLSLEGRGRSFKHDPEPGEKQPKRPSHERIQRPASPSYGTAVLSRR